MMKKKSYKPNQKKIKHLNYVRFNPIKPLIKKKIIEMRHKQNRNETI